MSIKVLMPFKKPGNSFFDEIIYNSELEFTYGSLKSDIKKFDVVLFHWPELIFNWGQPTKNNLEYLEETILKWKAYVKFIYVVHNEKNHFGMNTEFERLYQLIIDISDVMVHFGMYSLNKFKLDYPNKLHEYIPHPLYERTFKIHDKDLARKKIGIPLNKKVMLVPGRIRRVDERELVVNAFKSITNKNKLLLVPYMYKKSMPYSFLGSYRLQRVKIIKRLLDWYYNRENIGSYKFSYNLLSNEELGVLLSASDFIFIPRKENLNSGIFFLGLTYKKAIVGPAIGNIEEFLDMFGLPKFIPSNKESIDKAINDTISITENLIYDNEKLSYFNPKLIAKKWDNLLLSI